MRSLPVLSLVACMVKYVSTVPTLNGTLATMSEPAWGPSPVGRGTVNILLSSVITLTMCVWTALHLNVLPNATITQRVLRKLKFVAIGVFAPEAILMMAFQQYNTAAKLYKTLKTLPGFLSVGDKPTFGMESAFFVSMGGAALRTSGIFFTETTLKPEGFIGLAKQGNLISPSIINTKVVTDKGKADFLGKTLVCIQAFWLVVQCVIRKGNGLPVTLLELHIVIHVLCTVIIYACWMSKPLDVYEPVVVLQDTKLASLLTVLSYRDSRGILDIQCPTIGTLSTLPKSASDNVGLTQRPALGQNCSPVQGEGNSKELSQSTTKVNFFHLSGSTARIPGGSFRRNHASTKYRFSEESSCTEIVLYPRDTLTISDEIFIQCVEWDSDSGASVTVLDSIDIEILFSAAAAIRSGEYKEWIMDGPRIETAFRIENSTTRELMFGGSVMICLTIVLPMFYGAIHMAAWNIHFPTPIECMLWRTSSVIVGFLPGIYMLVRYLLSRLKLNTHWTKICTMCTIAPILFLLSFARVFLVVEAFISLRSLPIGSFQTTRWDDYWPHF